ncbi:MAG: tautomerase family protein [Gemmatimonadota bacterium]|nr:tautomerase family protein [Gemmatimonadota bacterium]
MPLVRITLVGDTLSGDQKRQLARNVTDGIVAVVGENLRPYVIISIDEAKSGDLVLGGHALTSEDVRAIAAGPGAAPGTADIVPADAPQLAASIP